MFTDSVWCGLIMLFVAGITLGLPTPAASAPWKLSLLVEPAAQRIEVRAVIERLPAPHFYLHEDLEIYRLTSRGKEIGFVRDNTSDVAPYTNHGRLVRLNTEDPTDLVIEYGGILSGVESSVNMVGSDLVELAYYACWYPLVPNHPGFAFELDVDMPAAFTTTTNARQVKSGAQDGRRVTRWASFGQATDIVVLAAPTLRVKQTETDLIEIETVYAHLDTAIIEKKVSQLIRAMDELSTLFGNPSITGFMRFAYSPREGWGYSRIPVFILPERTLQKSRNEGSVEADGLHGALHELAHFWWRIAATDGPEDWINEGLAEYSAFRLSGLLSGVVFQDTLLARYRLHAQQGPADLAIAETSADSEIRYLNRYERTTLMFHRAAELFGQRKLDGVLRQLHHAYMADRNATTESFLEAVESTMGAAARAYFTDCLYDPTQPTVMGEIMSSK